MFGKATCRVYPPTGLGIRLNVKTTIGLPNTYIIAKDFVAWGLPTEPGFVSIGEAAGESLPAGYRRYDKGCGHSDNECNQNEDSDELRGYYHWGDSVSFQGYYFATLATEYAMFQQLGFDTTETLNDLYQAMMAFNRLDEAAEIHYEMEPLRDGFFVRDDVPGDFWQNDDGTYRFPRYDAYEAFCFIDSILAVVT